MKTFTLRGRRFAPAVYLLSGAAFLACGTPAEEITAATQAAPDAAHVTAPQTVHSFDASAGELPEGIASDPRGDLYVGMSGRGEIWKLSPTGEVLGVLASFPLVSGDFGVLGVTVTPGGLVYAAVNSAEPATHGVWEVDRTGSTTRVPGSESVALPNATAVDADGTIYITDSAAGAVWRVAPGGTAAVWVQDALLAGTGAFGLPAPIGANGIALEDGRSGVFGDRLPRGARGAVLTSNSEKGLLVQIPILADGTAGEPVAVVDAPAALFGLDGIRIDPAGVVYGALNAQNAIVRIDGSGIEAVAAGPPFDFPADLTFGRGRDSHALFVTSFSLSHFLSDPPTPEQASPAILRVPL